MLIGLCEGLISCFRSNDQGHKCHFCKKMFLLILLIKIYRRALLFNILIGLSKDKTSIDFGFTRSKGKVTRATFVK